MKKRWLYLIGMLMILLLAGCGTKSQEEIVESLNAKVEALKGYKLNAKMTLTMGSENQSYDVEIWHNKPDFYRVHMKNAERNQSQMILKNTEGVYVLTPALNKSFKFQSDWPKNSSQPYLYESLVEDILKDSSAKLTETEDHYVFETKTRYQYNKMLPIQEITFNKKDLTPVSVKVMDQDRNEMLAVEFSKAEFDSKFDEGSFDLQRNMTSAQIEVPVSTTEQNETNDFNVLIPLAELQGTSLVDEQEVETDNGKRVILTYEGEKSFTLIQEKVEVINTASMSSTFVNGDPVDLGFTIGALTGNTLQWTANGVEYMLASNDLTQEEMVMLAQSVQAAPEK
ncbi:outer membrane lipoprotein carrier protein LolA [Caldibacillus lycopersici]|uniref:Outer membrane lipoprotein carrier protein LolA n=1 Tax=Perspicuibacillus lycopersici TaxID=1325689 RepID=A0AAE3LNV9_9BACI|nr:outer membrane lipoprotein carrier protein LolA [Perspicuibacillus lycopersici]MCU9615160.1 outer membrane lipoprotein carrier protein LolA [Perspicuibacillus lycopersici]